VDCKVMSADGQRVIDPRRPLVACMGHAAEQIEAAVERAYGAQADEEA
jgi:hypothetical protein